MVIKAQHFQLPIGHTLALSLPKQQIKSDCVCVCSQCILYPELLGSFVKNPAAQFHHALKELLTASEYLRLFKNLNYFHARIVRNSHL